MNRVLIVVFVLTSISVAGQEIQTDWSGGSVATGVATSWNSYFSNFSEIAWCSIPGQLQLSSTPLVYSVEHLVASGITNPYAADIADLNSDGFNDIVAGSGVNDGVIAYYGSADGTWSEQVVSDNSPGAIGLKIDDYNGDGLLDIAACADTELQVFYNQGGSVPSWEVTVAGSGYVSLHEVESVDMDNDGDIDLIGADYDGDHLFWLRNQGGTPVSWMEFTVDATVDYPCKIDAVDINGDGNMDLVTAAWLDDKIIAYYGSGGSEPAWTSQEVDSSINAAHGVRACDIDSDGDMDLLSASINGSSLYLYRNQGGLTPSWDKDLIGTIAGAAIVRTGDIDGDGDQDVLSSSFGNAGVSWWENTENGTAFIKHLVKSGGSATSWVMPGDLDNDGDLDVLAVRYQGNSLYWYEVVEFQSSGYLESTILDTQESPEWASMEWTAEVPAGCSLSVQFRSSDDHQSMGAWSEEFYTPSTLSGLVHRYFQYRVNLNSADAEVSPVLMDFQLNWDPQGIEGHISDSFITVPNPCRQSIPITAGDALQNPGSVSIYNCSGNLIQREVLNPGDKFVMADLNPGLYLINLTTTGGAQQTESTVLLCP